MGSNEDVKIIGQVRANDSNLFGCNFARRGATESAEGDDDTGFQENKCLGN